MRNTRILHTFMAILICITYVATASAADKVTLDISNWIADPVGEELIDQFLATHPGWSVNTSPGVDTLFNRGELITAIAGGAGPDIFFENRYALQNAAASGLYEAITELVERAGIEADDFLSGPWIECTWEGELYAIPHHTDARGLYWNTDLFEELGFDSSVPPTTWEELRIYTRKMTRYDNDGNIDILGFDPYFMPDALYLFALGNDAEFISEDNKRALLTSTEIVEALEYMVELTRLVGGREAINLFYSSHGGFNQGKMAMWGHGNWAINWLKQFPEVSFDVCAMPVPAGHTFATWGCGFGFAIPIGARNPEAAMEFARFMVSPEAQKYYGLNMTHIPVLKQVLGQLYEEVDPRQAKFFDIVSQYRMYFLPGGPVTPILWHGVHRATEDAINMRRPPMAALQEANRTTQAEIDQFYSNLQTRW